MKYLNSFLEAKSKHDISHIDNISDILVEFTDESLFVVNSISRDKKSSKTFILQLFIIIFSTAFSSPFTSIFHNILGRERPQTLLYSLVIPSIKFQHVVE